MTMKIVPGLSEVVYYLICNNPCVLKRETHKMVHERLSIRIAMSDLIDVIFFLKLHRGVGYGCFKNEEAFTLNVSKNQGKR
jgi:hypothetical protein